MREPIQPSKPAQRRRAPPALTVNTEVSVVMHLATVRVRTFAWFGPSRRLSKEYKRLPAISEAMIYGAPTRIMLRRLAHPAS